MKKVRPNYIQYMENALHSFSGTDTDLLITYLAQPELFLPLMNQMESVLFFIDYRKGTYPYISPNAKTVEGYSAEEIMSYGPREFLVNFEDSDRNAITEQLFPDLVEIIKGLNGKSLQKIKFCLNYRLLQPDGSYRMLLQQTNIISVNEQHEPLVLMGTISRLEDGYKKGEMFLRVLEYCDNEGWKTIQEKTYNTNPGHLTVSLSEAEMKVLRHINDGKTSKEAAIALNLSPETVNRHRKNIIRKFGSGNMIKALMMARDNGII